LIDRTKHRLIDFSQLQEHGVKELPIVFDKRLLDEVEEKFALIKEI
jgi:hypothetical protein